MRCKEVCSQFNDENQAKVKIFLTRETQTVVTLLEVVAVDEKKTRGTVRKEPFEAF
jgi:hypothetical protein